MTEDQSPGENNIPGLSMDDITPNIYEGGFKTWECSIDLADFLLTMLCKGYNPRERICQFVEVNFP